MRDGIFKKIRQSAKAVMLRAMLIPILALVACTPDSVLAPPGDIVSSVRPIQTAPAVAVPDAGTPLGPVNGQAQEPNRGLGLAALSNVYSTPPQIASKPVNVSQCQRQLQRLGVRYETPPPVDGPGKCGIAYPVKVKTLSGGIDVVPDAVLNCPMALAFAKWVKAELAPAARTRYLAGIKNIHQMSAYSCRTMNSKRGAPLSEHATGNAIDIGKIKLNNGKDIVVKRPGFFAFREKSLLQNVRAESCKYFTTVLGPGSDVHHKDHFHFDLRQRKSGYRHCDL